MGADVAAEGEDGGEVHLEDLGSGASVSRCISSPSPASSRGMGRSFARDSVNVRGRTTYLVPVLIRKGLAGMSSLDAGAVQQDGDLPAVGQDLRRQRLD